MFKECFGEKFTFFNIFLLTTIKNDDVIEIFMTKLCSLHVKRMYAKLYVCQISCKSNYYPGIMEGPPSVL